MEHELARIRDEALSALDTCKDEDGLEAVRVRFLGRKGELTGVLRGIGELQPEQRRKIGEIANEIKVLLEERIVSLRAQWQEAQRAQGPNPDRVVPSHVPHSSVPPAVRWRPSGGEW